MVDYNPLCVRRRLDRRAHSGPPTITRGWMNSYSSVIKFQHRRGRGVHTCTGPRGGAAGFYSVELYGKRKSRRSCGPPQRGRSPTATTGRRRKSWVGKPIAGDSSEADRRGRGDAMHRDFLGCNRRRPRGHLPAFAKRFKTMRLCETHRGSGRIWEADEQSSGVGDLGGPTAAGRPRAVKWTSSSLTFSALKVDRNPVSLLSANRRPITSGVPVIT